VRKTVVADSDQPTVNQSGCNGCETTAGIFTLATGRLRPTGGLETQENFSQFWASYFFLLNSYLPSWVIARTSTNMYRCAAHDLIFFFFRKVWSILKRLAILGNFGGQTTKEKL
jgi:hypothetical protein